MRIAIVAESFLPNINGVTNSILRILEYCDRHGHDALVIAPGAREVQDECADYMGFPIARVPTVQVPLIDSLPIGVPTPTVKRALRKYNPDVVHVASPFVLGAAGAFGASQLGIPTVAVYQTDVAGFANNYHMKPLASAAWKWTRTIHNACSRTLAPSSVTIKELRLHKIRDVHYWARGVDNELFSPTKRSEALRRSWAPQGQKIVGYVGRLAAEKSVHRLVALHDRDDIQLVITGDGPDGQDLRDLLPRAIFTGARYGEELAEIYASLDLFIHPGEYETFCQAVQEALASGVPAIAPRAGGPIDLIDDGVDGELLAVSSFERDLSAAVSRLLAAEGYRDRCVAARESVTQRTWECLCDELIGHYRAAIESPMGQEFRPTLLERWRAEHEQRYA
ncbi:glycosyltransferase family 4 protein [Corynebacterium kroppenstedtii]|uniref:glycosyltransferase family 4 protein n=1 Tax=Corynebacterium sp. PCR 32 TaxID=3351342 RepID=UPI00309D5F46